MSKSKSKEELEKEALEKQEALNRESENSQEQLKGATERTKEATELAKEKAKEDLADAEKDKDVKAIKLAKEEIASAEKQIGALDIVSVVVKKVPNNNRLRVNDLEVVIAEQGQVIEVPYCMAASHPEYLQVPKTKKK